MKVLMLIHEFLLRPNPDNAYNVEAAKLFKENKEEYFRRAAEDAREKFKEYGEKSTLIKE